VITLQPVCLSVHLCSSLNFFVSYAVLVVSKETRRSVLPRISCYFVVVLILRFVCFGRNFGSLCLGDLRIIGVQK
jgi:hypothetical protein